MVCRFALQDGQAGVVVRELRQVGQRDLAGDDRVVPADVGLRVPGPMLELHAEPHPELLEVAPQRLEVDPELDRKGTRLIGRERPLGGQTSADEGLVRPGVDGWVTYAATAPGPQGMERGASVLARETVAS